MNAEQNHAIAELVKAHDYNQQAILHQNPAAGIFSALAMTFGQVALRLVFTDAELAKGIPTGDGRRVRGQQVSNLFEIRVEAVN